MKKLLILFLFTNFYTYSLFGSWKDIYNYFTGQKQQTNSAEVNKSTTTFKDIIGGIPEEINDLKKFISEDDKYFKEIGAEKPTGILLVGPPGTGKTMLAKAIAGELNAVFFHASAASFIETFLGSGPRKVRELFDKANHPLVQKYKIIIFIDEFDAIGKRDSGHEESGKTVNELLIAMDGFNKNKNITVIAATNRVEAIDEALLRPGRFDTIVNIPLPDEKKRYAIIKHYLFSKNRKVDTNIKIEDFAKKTAKFSCADLNDLVNKAAINAARKQRNCIMLEDLENAYQDVVIQQKKELYSVFQNLGGTNGQNDQLNFAEVNKSAITFKDVIGGIPEEICDLKKFISEDDEYFKEVGAEKPTGIVLTGPPGTGKTMLAKAIAGELNAVFLPTSAASFVELWIGTGPKKVRELFEQANNITLAKHKVIIFIDEMDAIGKRGQDLNKHEESNKTINELLIQMDGFSKNKNITVIAATNRVKDIDEALLRPGRFDLIVNIPLPDENKRYAIIKHYLFSKNRRVDTNINIEEFAKKTNQFNCAELNDLVNKAAINAARNKRKLIMLEDLEDAYLSIIKQKQHTKAKAYTLSQA